MDPLRGRKEVVDISYAEIHASEPAHHSSSPTCVDATAGGVYAHIEQLHGSEMVLQGPGVFSCGAQPGCMPDHGHPIGGGPAGFDSSACGRPS